MTYVTSDSNELQEGTYLVNNLKYGLREIRIINVSGKAYKIKYENSEDSEWILKDTFNAENEVIERIRKKFKY